ncbi:zinc finger protein 271-like [Uranotaenia lowii]|uniref:zinc finger protein 271-like n=1 Tax=Uranotaenia lowii TaxID=190385 RepID=UPI00247A6BD9|nr:zinc finger protein 271-like [Uranotaenia lowii]
MEVMDMNIDYDLTRICRSCRKDATRLLPIFGSSSASGVPLREMLTSCTQIQISISDDMPRNICTGCVEEITTAYNFRKRYEQSDVMLREYLTRRRLESAVGVSGQPVSMELFEVKPDIAFIDSDPLIEEKCFVTAIQSKHDDMRIDESIIEEIREDEFIKVDVYKPEVLETIKSDDDYDDGDKYAQDSSDEDYQELSTSRRIKMEKKNDEGHSYSRLQDGSFQCSFCNASFSRRRSIANHMRKKHNPNKKECPKCQRMFSTNYHLGRHMKVHEDEIRCSHCDKRYASIYYADYKAHMEESHPAEELIPPKSKTKPERVPETIEEEKPTTEILCKICDANFNRIFDLRMHLKTHCDSKTFADLNIHSKPYLFEEGYVVDNYLEHLVQQVCKGELYRFYQIVEADGEEKQLSDSDSDADEPNDDDLTRRKHICEICNQIFPRMRLIMKHAAERHNGNELMNCLHCPRSFPNSVLLMRHLKHQCENTTKKFICTFCNQKFMWQTSLNKHAQSMHKPSRPLKLLTEYRPTVADKSKAHICHICQKGFQRLEHLERHVKIHMPSEKKFECVQCHKKFNRKDNLRSHMKIHNKDPEEVDNKQPQLCVYCGRGFSNSSNLIVHMRRHTGDKPYKCDICDKGFPRSSDLQCHRRTHTGEKPCLCTICGKGFSRSNKLVRHMRIHTGSRPYACTYCDRSFTQSNDLTLHIRRHTGEKPYVCGVCNERFIQGTALKAHQRVTGHMDDGSQQPERFASISVNNPNRVGVLGNSLPLDKSGNKSDSTAKLVKPVKFRKKAASAAASRSDQLPVETKTSPAEQDSTPTSPVEGSSTGRFSMAGLHQPGYVPLPFVLPNYELPPSGLFSQSFSQQ